MEWNWAIPEKKQTGGLDDMECPGYIEEISSKWWIFQRLNKNDMEFPGVIKKMWNFQGGLGFRP